MNRLTSTPPRVPTPSPALPPPVQPATRCGIRPPLAVRLPRPAGRTVPPRAFATSRFGYDHSWIGGLAFAAALLVAGLAPARAADPLETWTNRAQNATEPNSFNELIRAGGTYFAAGGGGKIYHSTDTVNWTMVQTPSDQNLTGLVHANGMYVATGLRLTLLSSPNGQTWTKRAEHPDAGQWPLRFNQAIFSGGQFIAVGGKGAVQTSPDAITWTLRPQIHAEFYANGIAFGDGLYVTVGDGGTGRNVRTSPDLVTWTPQDPMTTNELEGVAYGNGVFVATGWNNTIVSSPDGVTWTKHPVVLQYQQRIWGVKFLNGAFFAFGQYGALLTSSDGVQWTKRPTGTTADISTAIYDGTRVVIAGGFFGVRQSDPWTAIPVEEPVDPDARSQIANISTRAWVGTGDNKLITGFIVQGTTPKEVLIRAVGPTLGSYGVGGTIADPQVTLFNGASQQIATNNDWGTFPDQGALATRTTAVSAFPLAAGSKDAALLITLPPGSYTIHTSGADGGTGVALAEVYDCATGGPCKLINISSRGMVGTGDNVAIPGFIVAGNKAKKLLVRGVGPTLGGYGVAGVLPNPKITLYNSAQVVVAENDDWTTAANPAELAAATTQVLAFPFTAGSTDAALVVTVPPGTYTAVVSGSEASTGVALVEVYEVE